MEPQPQTDAGALGGMTDLDFPAAHSMDTTWFAVDQVGHVGMFDTGENGHAPDLAQEESLLGELWTLRQARDGKQGTNDEWLDLDNEEVASRLRLFYFNYGDEFDPIGTYWRSASPDHPLHVDELPPVLRKACKDIEFRQVNFAEAEVVQPLEYTSCCYWYEEDRVAYLCSDEKTVRPLPGVTKERFRQFYEQFRQEEPERAKQLRFAGLEDEGLRPPPRRRKRKKDGS